MTDFVRILEPTGYVHVVERSRAPRPVSLEGLRPGILENTKANARLLMETMVDALRDRLKLQPSSIGTKPVAGPPSAAVVATLRENSDFVVVGTSD
jgi:hypothetical protein